MHVALENGANLYYAILPRRYFAAMFRVRGILSAMGADLASIGFFREPRTVVKRNRRKLERALAPFDVGIRTLDHVTRYPTCDGRPTAVTRCYLFDDNFVARLYERRAQVARAVDSVAIYKSREFSWFACVIPHENVALFRLSPDEHERLTRASIALFLHPPPHW